MQATFEANTCFNGGDSYYYATYYAPGTLSTPGNQPYVGQISTDEISGAVSVIEYKSVDSCYQNDDEETSYVLTCMNGKMTSK